MASSITPADAARAIVEGWWHAVPTSTSPEEFVLDDLISRLTPVFERAQAADTLERPDPMWECNIPEHGKCAELCFECCLNLVTEAVEDANAERDALRERAEAAGAALRRVGKVVGCPRDDWNEVADATEVVFGSLEMHAEQLQRERDEARHFHTNECRDRKAAEACTEELQREIASLNETHCELTRDHAHQISLRGAAEAAVRALRWALGALVDFCDDPNGSESSETLAIGLVRLLPAAREALAATEPKTASDAENTGINLREERKP